LEQACCLDISFGDNGNVLDLKKISPSKPFKGDIDISKILVADIEGLISSTGSNDPYMIAFYKGPKLDESIRNLTIDDAVGIYREYTLKNMNMDVDLMFKSFWIDIITKFPDHTCYFHNWAGYDSIISLKYLIEVAEQFDWQLEPMIRDGQLICLKISYMQTYYWGSVKQRKVTFTIKDSIKLIPGALGRLAKDYQVPVQKDHFPHYFNPLELFGQLDYKGPFPDYKYYEIKRTSLADYNEMVKEFNNTFDFMDFSSRYLKNDCIALYQVVIRFLKEMATIVPLNPVKSLTAPGIAYKTFRIEQLPKMEARGNYLYDLSRWNDKYLRNFYHGGIVDVYNPYFKGKGYHYDVNSLYPTAMLRDFPMGLPRILDFIDVKIFLNSDIFGFVECYIQAPDNIYGWIGLLPIKKEGRLILPSGIFKGYWLSEEIRFALKYGYKLVKIVRMIQFDKVSGLFNDLIYKLNDLKIKAQLDKRPVVRNIAKLLMNSMYGRFGIHNDFLRHRFVLGDQFNNYANLFKIKDITQLGNTSLISYSQGDVNKVFNENLYDMDIIKQIGQDFGIGNNVPIAATVTTYSRMIINEYKIKAIDLGYDLYYSDTDSIMISGPLPDSDISSTVLGKMKLEHVFDEAYFLMPKVYYLRHGDSETFKCKGYPGDLTRDDFIKLYNGETLHLKVTKWFKEGYEGNIYIKHGLPYNLRVSFNKRQQIFNSDNRWIGTAPLVMNDQ